MATTKAQDPSCSLLPRVSSQRSRLTSPKKEEMQEVETHTQEGSAADKSAEGEGQEGAATLDASGGTTSGNTTAPHRTTSDNTAGPSKTTPITTTVPSRTISGKTAGDMGPKKREKRDHSRSSSDQDEPLKNKADTRQTSPDNHE